jgi:hypothetical protein
MREFPAKVALLGRRDGPKDGMGDYCTYLGATLGRHAYNLEIVRVPRPERGWGAALVDPPFRLTALS